MDSSDNNFEILNGRMVKGGSLLYNSNNRAFRYGDGVFETIRVVNQQPLFIEDHWKRLSKGLSNLTIPLPASLELQTLKGTIRELLQKNVQDTVRLRLVVFREATGFYKPGNVTASWHLSVTGPVETSYQTSATGISADVFEGDYKTSGALSNLKTLNSLLYIVAGVCASQNGLDDVLLKNHRGNIIESVNSNLFLRKGTSFTTPPLSEGCLDGVMRKQLTGLLQKKNLVIHESPVNLEDVMQADELILTNVIQGANWISSFRGKNYGNEYANKINGWLNEYIGEADSL